MHENKHTDEVNYSVTEYFDYCRFTTDNICSDEVQMINTLGMSILK